MNKRFNWDEIFRKYTSFTGSVTNFCKQENIPTSSFYKHRRIRGLSGLHLEKEKKEATSLTPNFIELGYKSPVKERDPSSKQATIRLSNINGITVEVFL